MLYLCRLQIPADNWAYTILHSLLPDFVKLQLPVHSILYVSGQHACWLHIDRPNASCCPPHALDLVLLHLSCGSGLEDTLLDPYRSL